MHLYFVTPVWGVNHLRLFLSVGLPSLLAPANLPGLQSAGECRFLIYTRVVDEAALRASTVFARLAELMTVEIHRIEEPISNAHRTMSDCHADALRRADADDAAAIFIPPDCVWSNGSMVRIEQLARAGKSMVHISGIRLDRDVVSPKLAEYASKDGCVLEIAARSLVAVGLAHLHRIAFLHFWKDYPDDGLMPANLYWTVPGAGLTLRCFHLHPLLVKPQIKFARFNSTIDDDLGLSACPDHTRDHVVTDSDDILAFELSGPERVVSGDFYKNSVDSVAAWMEIGTNARHHLLAQRAIRIHSGPIDEALWQPIERESEEVIKQVLRIYALPSYAIALRHPAVVLWRYYAMTLGRGRYAGRRYRLARLTLRLSRRLVHGNQRIRSIFFDRDELPRPWHPVRIATRLTAWRATRAGDAQPASHSLRIATPRMRLIDPIAAATYQRRGNFKRSFGFFGGAVHDYSKAIDFSPRNTALYFLRGMTRLEIGNPQEAKQDFEEALQLDPDNRQLQWLLQHARVTIEFETLFGNPFGDSAYQWRGDLKRKLGLVGAAIGEYDKAIAQNPRNLAAYYLRGTARLRTRNAPGAVEDFTAALKLDPDNEHLRWLVREVAALKDNLIAATSHQRRGEFKRKLGFIAAAIRSYDRAIAHNPRNPALYYLRGTARLQNRDRHGAAEDFAAALKLDPENKCLRGLANDAFALEADLIAATRHQRRGEFKRTLGFIAAAIRSYDRAIAHNPRNPAMYYLRGTARLQNQDRHGAAEDFAAALKLDPENKCLRALASDALALEADLIAATRHQRRGEFKRKLGFIAAAIRSYDRAIAHNPRNPAVYYLRGMASLESGDRDGAAKDFAAAVKIEPENKCLQWVLKDAVALNDNIIAATKHQRRGEFKRKLGFIAAAIRSYDRAIAHNPRNPAVYYLRGTARLQNGDRSGAAEDFGAALKLDPNNKGLQWLLRNVHEARAMGGLSLITMNSPLLHGCFFNHSGTMRPWHPKWLFYRSFLSILRKAVRHEDRSVLILAEYGYFSYHLQRSRPGLHVEAVSPEELADFDATGKWDVVIWNGLHGSSREDALRLLRAYRASGSRVVCIAAEPADRLAFEGVDEFRALDSRGTLLCYRFFAVVDRLRVQMRDMAPSCHGGSKLLVQSGQLMLATVAVSIGSLLNGLGLAMDLSIAAHSSEQSAATTPSIPRGAAFDEEPTPMSVVALADKASNRISATAADLTFVDDLSGLNRSAASGAESADSRMGPIA